MTRGQETELPRVIKLRYIDSGGDYRQLVAESRRLEGQTGRVSEAGLPIMLDADHAGRIADSWLHESWIARDRVQLTVPPTLLGLEPGDLVEVDHAGLSRAYRITEISDQGAREIEARAIDTSVYVTGRSLPRVSEPPERPVTGSPDAVFIDLPLLPGEQSPEAGIVGISQSPWPGKVAFYKSAVDVGYRLAGLADSSATVGRTVTALGPTIEGRLDRSARLTVELDFGQLQSVPLLTMLSGANGAAVETSNGLWEVLQFETASLVGPRRYELSGLLRAQGGTEDAMAAGIPEAARFVVLNPALKRVAIPVDAIGLPQNWLVGPARFDIGHASYHQYSHAYSGRGWLPLSPVHLRGMRQGQDLEISWVRRTRIGGDNWELAEVPLSEASEAYEVDILSGNTVVRTLSSNMPSATYSASDQVADFGAIPATVSCRVYQIGATTGRGVARAAVV